MSSGTATAAHLPGSSQRLGPRVSAHQAPSLSQRPSALRPALLVAPAREQASTHTLKPALQCMKLQGSTCTCGWAGGDVSAPCAQQVASEVVAYGCVGRQAGVGGSVHVLCQDVPADQQRQAHGCQLPQASTSTHRVSLGVVTVTSSPPKPNCCTQDTAQCRLLRGMLRRPGQVAAL